MYYRSRTQQIRPGLTLREAVMNSCADFGSSLVKRDCSLVSPTGGQLKACELGRTHDNGEQGADTDDDPFMISSLTSRTRHTIAHTWTEKACKLLATFWISCSHVVE